MIDLNFTESQAGVRDAVRKLCADIIAPAAERVDKKKSSIYKNFGAVAEAGIPGVVIGSEFGGAGGDMVSAALAFEELAAACTSTALAAHAGLFMPSVAISLFGNREQKEKYLPALAKGEAVGCFALTEPHGGCDAAAVKTTGEMRGDSCVINGTKAYVTNAPAADFCIVFVQTGEEEKSISAFIVDEKTEGMSTGSEYEMMCTRGAAISELVFDDCEVPLYNMLGEEGHGFEVAMKSIEHGRIIMAAIGMGLVRAAMNESIECAETRMSFGKPLGAFQEVNHKVAKMRVDLEVGRQLLYYAAWMKDQKMNCGTDIAVAKLFASEAAFRCVSDAVQVHGSAGLTCGSRVERLYRDVKVCSMAGGTSEMMRLTIAADVLAD